MAQSTPARDGALRPDGTPYAVAKAEDDWQITLNPMEYHVLREAGTEAPFVGEFTDTRTAGLYCCRGCG
jgi:peptide-methionine (R)-S-oxide reductase